MRLKVRLQTIIIFTSPLFTSSPAWSDGNSVDKVYHPYVYPMETEVEWRAIFQNDGKKELDNQQIHRLGIGRSFFENWFTEVYVIGENTKSDDFDANNIEFEALVQLTEQGEYAADFGLLIELARDFEKNRTELSTGLLLEKEWGRLVGALNAHIEYESKGKFNENSISNEIEFRTATQLRYRYSRLFEPAIEFYSSQDTVAFGPTIMGDIRTGIAKKLHWEFGIIYGLRDDTPDQTIRTLLEYEF